MKKIWLWVIWGLLIIGAIGLAVTLIYRPKASVTATDYGSSEDFYYSQKITGKVTDSSNNALLAGVRVTAECANIDQCAHLYYYDDTNSNGEYTIDWLPVKKSLSSANYNFTVSKDAYDNSSRTITVVPYKDYRGNVVGTATNNNLDQDFNLNSKPEKTEKLNCATVAIYDHANYGEMGAAECLPVRDYDVTYITKNDLGDNLISAVSVAPGYKVILYKDAGFAGNSLTLTADEPTLSKRNFDNITSSLKVALNKPARTDTTTTDNQDNSVSSSPTTSTNPETAPTPASTPGTVSPNTPAVQPTEVTNTPAPISSCSDNSQCLTNYCSKGVCVKPRFFAKISLWFGQLFSKIISVF